LQKLLTVGRLTMYQEQLWRWVWSVEWMGPGHQTQYGLSLDCHC
jgi:hypothetical protein